MSVIKVLDTTLRVSCKDLVKTDSRIDHAPVLLTFRCSPDECCESDLHVFLILIGTLLTEHWGSYIVLSEQKWLSHSLTDC